MRTAVLFNSDHPKYEGIYGPAITERILSTGIIQRSGCKITVRSGEVLTRHLATKVFSNFQISEEVYFSHPWQLLLARRIRATYYSDTIYAWVIDGISERCANKLHPALLQDDAYLGMHGVDFTNKFHRDLYHSYLFMKFRICRWSCCLFHPFGQPDETIDHPDALRKLGFTQISREAFGPMVI